MKERVIMKISLRKIMSIIVCLISMLLIISFMEILVYPIQAQETRQNAALTPHPPIIINSSSDFTPANGVSDGDGSLENPWVIENVSITTSRLIQGVGRFCIFIMDTSDYLIIRNCYISNYSSFYGIYGHNVSNVIIENNVIVNNHHSGIVFGASASNNIKIINNYIAQHQEYGIALFTSKSNVIISNNTFKLNQFADILCPINPNITFSGNDFEIGISIDGADPYDPNNPPTPNNQIYVWVTVITIVIVFSALVLWYKKSKLKEEDRNIERKDDETNLK